MDLTEKVSFENVEIWFQDEAKVGQQGTITRVWGIKGKRPRLKRQRGLCLQGLRNSIPLNKSGNSSGKESSLIGSLMGIKPLSMPVKRLGIILLEWKMLSRSYALGNGQNVNIFLMIGIIP